MKKLLIYLFVIVGIFSFSFEKVNAASISTIDVETILVEKIDKSAKNNNTNTTSLNLIDNSTTLNCDGIFSPDAAALVNELLNYIRFIAPILLILFTALDFAQATLQQDNYAMKKATGKVTKRAIATILLFLIPTILRAIFNLEGINGALVSDPLCGMSGNTISNIKSN
jgi:hypothetical protein